MSHRSLNFDVAGGVATVRLTEADRGNPFDATLCAELRDVATSCSLDDAVRCVLIESTGRFFSVGGDLAVLGRAAAALPAFVGGATVDFHAAVSRFASMDAPVVTAVHGMAAGGGVSLAAGADVLIAGRSAQFYAAYQGIGMAIDGGGSHHVPRRVGHGRATNFYLRNEMWSAEDAFARGLVDEVVDDDGLLDTARALAAQLATGPTRAYGAVKRLLDSSWDRPLDTQLEAEAQAMVATARTADAWEGISAVASKRPPEFRGA